MCQGFEAPSWNTCKGMDEWEQAKIKGHYNWREYGNSVITIRSRVHFPTLSIPRSWGVYIKHPWKADVRIDSNQLPLHFTYALSRFPDALPRIVGTPAECTLPPGPAKHK